MAAAVWMGDGLGFVIGLVGFWLGCGLLGFGIWNGDARRRWPEIYDGEGNMLVAHLIGGPIALVASATDLPCPWSLDRRTDNLDRRW